jgi:hypothetical protein
MNLEVSFFNSFISFSFCFFSFSLPLISKREMLMSPIGDIIGIAQLVSVLEQEGFKLRVEDLVDRPIMIEQLALCAVHEKKMKERERAEIEELENPTAEGELEVTQKKGLKKMLDRAGGLAKKLKLKKKGGEDAIVGEQA